MAYEVGSLILYLKYDRVFWYTCIFCLSSIIKSKFAPWPMGPAGYYNETIVGANSYALSRTRLDLKTKNNS